MANSLQKVRIVFRNIKDKYGFTVLHHAVYRENLRLVNKLLKERGVRAEEKDEQGNTPLHLAALRKKWSYSTWRRSTIEGSMAAELASL